jgi:hypothetical protein
MGRILNSIGRVLSLRNTAPNIWLVRSASSFSAAGWKDNLMGEVFKLLPKQPGDRPSKRLRLRTIR